MKQTIAIIHYNTPELTEACIKSLRKVGCQWPIVILDNSDERPFKLKMKGVKVLNNTKGKIIDFDKFLSDYPDRSGKRCVSVRHMLSIEKLFDLIPDGFLLVESDILLKENPEFLWQEKYVAVGKEQEHHGYLHHISRLLPMLCYFNVPLIREHGLKYHDPSRSFGLQKDPKCRGNWYDTGASFLEDIRRNPDVKALLYSHLQRRYEHYRHASWQEGEGPDRQREWLEKYKGLWYTPDNSDVTIIICAHDDFKPVVNNDVYEVVDIRKIGDKDENGVPGPFYSELLHMHNVSKRKKLPKYIGFCHYRRYFGFMNNVPDLPALIEKHGAITTKAADLGMTMKQQYATWGNPEDLDIVTAIIGEKYPDFAEAWGRALNSHKMHLGSLSIQRTEDWQQMVQMAWDVVQEYLKRIGGDIEKHVKKNPEAYHLDRFNVKHETRVGGQFCERMVSAWIDWKHPNAYQVQLRVTSEKIDNPWAQ